MKLVSVDPHFAYLRVTENCNSMCIACHAWKNRSVDELTTEEIKDVLRQLKDIGVDWVWFSGGEPLIRHDVGKLVRESELLGFKHIFVQTNGLLLHEKANELIENGVTHISVSIDGIEKTNDLIRGVPLSYERSIRGIKTVNEIKIKRNLRLPVITVISTLLNQNLEEIPQLLEMCRKLGVLWNFNLLDNKVDFFTRIDFPGLLINDEKKINETINYLKKARRDMPRVVGYCNHVLEFARGFLKGDVIRTSCTLGFTHICIGAHGEVYSGCLVHGPVGNLRESSLTSIIRSKQYRKNAEKMYARQCPGNHKGCTFFFPTNVIIKHLISHRLICQRKS